MGGSAAAGSLAHPARRRRGPRTPPPRPGAGAVPHTQYSYSGSSQRWERAVPRPGGRGAGPATARRPHSRPRCCTGRKAEINGKVLLHGPHSRAGTHRVTSFSIWVTCSPSPSSPVSPPRTRRQYWPGPAASMESLAPDSVSHASPRYSSGRPSRTTRCSVRDLRRCHTVAPWVRKYARAFVTACRSSPCSSSLRSSGGSTPGGVFMARAVDLWKGHPPSSVHRAGAGPAYSMGRRAVGPAVAGAVWQLPHDYTVAHYSEAAAPLSAPGARSGAAGAGASPRSASSPTDSNRPPAARGERWGLVGRSSTSEGGSAVGVDTAHPSRAAAMPQYRGTAGPSGAGSRTAAPGAALCAQTPRRTRDPRGAAGSTCPRSPSGCSAAPLAAACPPLRRRQEAEGAGRVW